MSLRLTMTTAVGAFLADQASKVAVVHALDLKSRLIVEVWPPFLNFVMAWNRGANFGLGDSLGRWFWIALAAGISVGLLVWARRIADPLRLACIGMLVGGAAGNALDRLLYGAVADFLNMSCCGIDNPYAFNLADVFIFAGAAGLILREGSDKQAAER